LDASKPVLDNAQHVVDLVRGGTDCSAPLAYLNGLKATASWVLMISDNQSWLASGDRHVRAAYDTAFEREWATFVERSPEARLACLDLQPYATAQIKSAKNAMNFG